MKKSVAAILPAVLAATCFVCRSESMTGPELGSFLTFNVELNEGDEFYAAVLNAYSRPVFEITDREFFTAGVMTDLADLKGLKEYLMEIGVMVLSQDLVMG